MISLWWIIKSNLFVIGFSKKIKDTRSKGYHARTVRKWESLGEISRQIRYINILTLLRGFLLSSNFHLDGKKTKPNIEVWAPDVAYWLQRVKSLWNIVKYLCILFDIKNTFYLLKYISQCTVETLQQESTAFNIVHLNDHKLGFYPQTLKMLVLNYTR